MLGGDENKVNKTKVEKENSNMLNKQNITGRAILAAAVIIGTSTTFAGGFAQPDTASKASAPRGNVTFETTVKVGGVKAENGSDALIGSTTLKGPYQIGGDLKVKSNVQVGRDVTARNNSLAEVGSVTVQNSRIAGSLTADTKAVVGVSVQAENGSYANLGSPDVAGVTMSGDLTFKSDVNVRSSVKAGNGSNLSIGGLVTR